MSSTFKMLISNWPRTRKFNRLLNLHAGKAVAFDFSHCHALITLYVQFLCLIGQILTGEFMRKIYAVSGNLLTDSWSWQSFVREFCVILWCFKLSFSTWCTKWNTAATKSLLLSMAGLFIGFLVEKCVACQNWVIRFRMASFSSFTLLNA